MSTTGRLPLPGGCVGKYELQELLDRGGQATVFRAWDSQLQRDVALKLSHPQPGTDAAACSRTLQEGAFLARINHPGLARVYDCGSVDGNSYLVLEYLRGTHLQRYAEQNSLGSRQIALFLDEISGAVAAAHQAGILHLDLKPENVMVTPDGHCKLIDFGLAWRPAWRQACLPPLMIGTREYMAPEQVIGNTAELSEATDVFGLGGLLFTLLTGEPPLPPILLDAESLQEHLETATAKLNAPDVDRSLARLCRTALAVSPEERFRNMAEFRRALHLRRSLRDRLLAGLFILAGFCLFCLGMGVFSLALAGENGKTRKDNSHCGVIGRPKSRMSLEISVQANSSPAVLVWSPSLGLQEFTGLKKRGEGEQSRWRLRSRSGSISHATEDEVICILAIDGSLSRARRREIFERFQLEEQLAQLERSQITNESATISYLFTPRTRVLPIHSANHALRSAALQLSQTLQELPVTYSGVILTRSARATPDWKLDLFLQLD